ncbi:hypothetical protein ACHAW5_004649 [Stephanodiscus triporus]|uniref:Uncharacterized protein n=1 Tax=Stephanodiscus triporus TaxID=2934178 RepID=A0ABD3MMG0_9STRA
MKVALERMRPLEKKMRYQIDKLLALSTLGGGAGTFAAMGREEEVANDKDETTKIADDGVDPLSFKPDLEGMMKMFVEEEEEDGNNGPNGADSKYEGSDDDDDSNVDEGGGKSSSYKARIALEKDDNDPQPNDGRSNVYQPPRLQSMPFDIDDNERAMQKRRRQLEKQRDRLSRSELTAVMRSQFTDAPEEEDARGGALLGMQSESARRIAARDADVREFEERQMIRLTMGKKERGERKRMMREEMSNLGAIAGGLGSLMVGVDDAFGGGGGTRRRDGEARDGRGSGADNDGAGGPFKTVGMRKRRVDVLEGGDGSKKRKKKKGGATNTYQKSLYGDGGGGGGGGMSKKKK